MKKENKFWMALLLLMLVILVIFGLIFFGLSKVGNAIFS